MAARWLPVTAVNCQIGRGLARLAGALHPCPRRKRHYQAGPRARPWFPRLARLPTPSDQLLRADQ